MTEVELVKVVFDQDIYPRSEWSQPTVDRYAEALAAGDSFPPIVLEADTNRLLDGMHRAKAHKQAGVERIVVEFHEVPPGVPAKLYAASLSTKHGDRITREDLAAIARDIARENPEYNLATIAQYCGVTRQTVGKWVGDITERRQMVREVRAALLAKMGYPVRDVAEQLGMSKSQVSRDVNADIAGHGEEVLREALDGLPEAAGEALEAIRQEKIFASWSDEERDLLKRLRSGETIVVTLRGAHDRLIRWADSAGLYQRIDRKTEWGNPFELPADGDRATVIRHYREHYLPYKPSLLKRLDSLAGKALGCWCFPEACHGDVLAVRVAAGGARPGEAS